MSYNMKKFHTKDWERIFQQCDINQKKLLNPFYSKYDFITDLYKQQLGKVPNLKSPSTFTEKQNYLKINKDIQKYYWQYADKHHVRQYVSQKIGHNYLIPSYLYTKKLTIADLENLPNKFVLKTTNGSGTNYIVQDKTKENLQKIVSYMNWLSTLKYGYMWGEFFYNKIRPGIVAEKLLLDEHGNIPDDLKCYCFRDRKGTKRKILYIERVIGDERYRVMFDENWKPIEYGSNFEKLDIKIKKPKNYREILSVFDKLSEDFSFVRVDLFLLGNKIYFGELTFIPTAGYMQFTDTKIDKLWGSWIDETIINKEKI